VLSVVTAAAPFTTRRESPHDRATDLRRSIAVIRPSSIRSSCAVVVAALLLTACQTASAPPAPPPSSAPVGVTPNTFAMPSGSGCAGEVARFQAVMDNDLATGHTTKGVHERVSAEIAQARSTCQAGQDGQAVAQLNATKSRFGYR
jgi:hypothetical protein